MKQIAIVVALLGAGITLDIQTNSAAPLIIFMVITAAYLLYANWGSIPDGLKLTTGRTVGLWLIILWVAMASFVLGSFFWWAVAVVLIWVFGPRLRTAWQRRRAGST